MSKNSSEWKVLEHGPIERLSENLWRVEGEIPRMSLRRVMTIARMSDGKLVFHSPIALNEPEMKDVEAFGTPSYVLVPNGYHRMDSPAYQSRYENLGFYTTTGARAKVEEVIKVEGTYSEFPGDASVSVRHLPGVGDREGVMLVHSVDGASVILNDIVMNMDRKRDPLGFLFTTLMGSAPGPRVSRLAKMALVKDRSALRAELERLSETKDLVRLIVSHEKVASGADAALALRKAATYL